MFLQLAVLSRGGEMTTGINPLKRSKEIWLEWIMLSDEKQQQETRDHWDKRLAAMTVNDVRELTVLRKLAAVADRYFEISEIRNDLSQPQQMEWIHMATALERWKVAADIVHPDVEVRPANLGWAPLELEGEDG